MKKIDNPLRIKVTGKCNRDCSFCHHEGGDCNIEEIFPDAAMKPLIRRLCSRLSIHSAALTGGEPLMHPDLPEFASFLTSDCGFDNIYITSNGILPQNKEFWNKMKKYRLKKVNISVPDVFSEYKRNSAITEDVFHNQIENISLITRLGIPVDVNVVVFSDFLYTQYVIETLNSLNNGRFNFHIYLLPNLTKAGYKHSIETIKKVCKNIGYIQDYACSSDYISNASVRYHDREGNQLFIKTTQKNNQIYRLPGLCNNCKLKDDCYEGFYGLRLEKRRGNYFIRLCLIKDTQDTLIPLDQFFMTDIYKGLMKKWGGSNSDHG